MSKTMMALEILNPGVDAVLSKTQRAVPEPKQGEVLIKVMALGINRPDLIQKQGRYNPPEGVTDIPGLEIAGEIVAVNDQGQDGNGVRLSVGDRVCALVAGGGYAQYCTAPMAQCLSIPKGFSMVEAACLPETFFTVWFNLYIHAELKKGETILIHGGTSGIGTTAIQMAKKYFDTEVYVTAGTDEKCDFCRDLGADLAINYKTQDFVEVILEKTSGKGVDVVLDMVGGDYVARNLKVLKPKGRHVSIAVQRGSVVELDMFQIMRKQLILTGSTLRPQPLDVKAGIATSLFDNIWPLFEAGQIKPIIDRVFDFDQGEDAQQYMLSSAHMGKIALHLQS